LAIILFLRGAGRVEEGTTLAGKNQAYALYLKEGNIKDKLVSGPAPLKFNSGEKKLIFDRAKGRPRGKTLKQKTDQKVESGHVKKGTFNVRRESRA